MKAVIQAGGQGSRLRPYTLVLPKPLLPVGNHPVIELLLKWLRRNGVEEAIITTGYLGHLLRALCGDGEQWDMKIEYSEEVEPLGTIGALDLVRDQLSDTFLVINGDLLTDLNLRDFISYHHNHGCKLTVGVTKKSIQVDLGVIDVEEQSVRGFREKPAFTYEVSMGIYCMEPSVLDLIPRGVPFGFDDLMHEMLERKDEARIYRHDGAWKDLGRPGDFQEAQEMAANGAFPMLGI